MTPMGVDGIHESFGLNATNTRNIIPVKATNERIGDVSESHECTNGLV